MTAMDYRDLLTDVSIYLREILAKEKLSDHAEIRRKQLLQKLDFRETSPQAYIDMNVNGKGESPKENKSDLPPSEYYELLVDANAKDKNVNEANNTQPILENVYYNVTPSIISEEFKQDISMKLSNKQPVLSQLKNNKINSTVGVKKDSPDRISESSSITYSTSSKSDEVGEVLTISASALRYSAVKYGPLSRKEKFVLFVELSKQYWVALLAHILYVYSSEKDSKPVFEIDITGYQARPVVPRESNKKDFIFEVIAPGKKTYQFIAESSTEMEQWISAICQCGKINDSCLKSAIEISSPKETVRQLPSIPLTQMLYDQPNSTVRPVDNLQSQVYEQMQEPNEDLYHYIEHQPVNDNVSAENENTIYKNANVSLNSSEEDENMYYNLIPFSDNEECIYDVITEKNVEMKSESTKKMSEIIEEPKTECSIKDTRPTELIIQDEIYEFVN